jgi:hypothetical protein
MSRSKRIAGAKRPKSQIPFQDRLSVSIPELADASSIGRGSIYNAVKRGDLRLRKVGFRSIVMVADAVRWLRGEPMAGGQHAPR